MIRSVLSADLTKPVPIVVYAEENHCAYCDRTLKLTALLEEGGKVQPEYLRFSFTEDIEMLGLERSPAIVIMPRRPGQVTFYGAPMGLELSTFLAVLKVLSAKPFPMGKPTKHVEIFVSMVCPGCHTAVLDMLRFHELLRLDVIAAAQFPDLARQRKVKATPAVFFREQEVPALNHV